MKPFSLSMQTGDDPKESLTEIIDALRVLCEDLEDHRAAGGITLGSGHVESSEGFPIGRWSIDRV